MNYQLIYDQVIERARIGKPSGMLGKVQSPETRAKISATKHRNAELKRIAQNKNDND